MADNELTQAQKDEQKKLKLENSVQREINALFVQMNKANAESIATTGNVVQSEKFLNNWENLIERHDIRVQDAFRGDVEKLLPEDDQGLSEAEALLLLMALKAWRDKKSKESARIITDTNARQLNESIRSGRELFTEQNDRPPSNRELGLSAAAVFRRKYKPRVGSIAESETQSAAEGAKIIEASVLSGEEPSRVLNPILPSAIQSTKTWRNTGTNIRPLHKRLAGVTKTLDKAFETGGERLMHPGDTSLGATAKNIMNCKCALTFNIKRMRTYFNRPLA